MMDREHGAQQKMLCVTMESLMPEKHFLRDLDRLVDFSFVYDKVAELYSNTGRRSVDPVVIVKMMLLGYLYGIDSERRLEQEVQVNIAYRWFLGINLDELFCSPPYSGNKSQQIYSECRCFRQIMINDELINSY